MSQKMKKAKPVFSAAGAEIIGALTELRDTLRAKVPLDQKFTVRTVELDIRTREYGAEDVKRTRQILNVSQSIFARFLGVDVKTVRSWEQGLKRPSAIACRFMDEIAVSPDHWHDRLRQMIARKESDPLKA
jgi:putative transcriptional regulator